MSNKTHRGLRSEISNMIKRLSEETFEFPQNFSMIFKNVFLLAKKETILGD